MRRARFCFPPTAAMAPRGLGDGSPSTGESQIDDLAKSKDQERRPRRGGIRPPPETRSPDPRDVPFDRCSGSSVLPRRSAGDPGAVAIALWGVRPSRRRPAIVRGKQKRRGAPDCRCAPKKAKTVPGSPVTGRAKRTRVTPPAEVVPRRSWSRSGPARPWPCAVQVQCGGGGVMGVGVGCGVWVWHQVAPHRST